MPPQSSAAHHGDVTCTALLRGDLIGLPGATQAARDHVEVGARNSLDILLLGRDNDCIIVIIVPRIGDQHCRGQAPMARQRSVTITLAIPELGSASATCTFTTQRVLPQLLCAMAEVGRAPLLALSVRELEIARLIAEDLSDKEIGSRLGIETSTIRTHVKRIFTKLGVRRRSGVASLLSRHC